jgi:hypothetical protein
MDKEKFSSLKADFKLAAKQPNRIKASAAVFEKHKDFINSLSADEALEVENALGFWSAAKQE